MVGKIALLLRLSVHSDFATSLPSVAAPRHIVPTDIGDVAVFVLFR